MTTQDQSSHFDKIILPTTIIADMYKHSLVIMDDVQTFSTISSGKSELPGVSEDIALYETSIQKEVKAVNIETERKEEFRWLGGFEKKILVLVKDENAVHVADEELALLTKMLQALELSIADIALVNIGRYPSDHLTIIQKLAAEIVLLFDVEPSSTGLPMRFPEFQVQNWNKCKYLYCPSLAELNTVSEQQKDLKQKLWIALKKIFEK